MDYKLVLPF